MNQQNFLAGQFEANRGRLRGVAFRMLGSLSEADDAVQEAWLRLSRTEAASIDNLGGWLTTVVARICLDMLRARKSRGEAVLDGDTPEPVTHDNPEAALAQEAELADAVGLALLVVLQALAPAERIAFVLHDMFDVPFEQIAPIVGRTATATRQLASRARRRVQGKAAMPDADRAGQRGVVEAFLAAARGGDMQGLLAALDPDVVVRADAAAMQAGERLEMRGAETVARFYLGKAQLARPALIDGGVGVVVAPRGRLLLLLELTFASGRIAGIKIVADPARLSAADIAVLEG